MVDSDNVMKRKYWALVIGEPDKKKGRIVAPLKKVFVNARDLIGISRDANAVLCGL